MSPSRPGASKKEDILDVPNVVRKGRRVRERGVPPYGHMFRARQRRDLAQFTGGCEAVQRGRDIR